MSERNDARVARAGRLQGCLFALAAFPFALQQLTVTGTSALTNGTGWRFLLAFPAAICWLSAGVNFTRRQLVAARLAWAALALTSVELVPWCFSSPFVALVVGTIVVFLSVEIYDVCPRPGMVLRSSNSNFEALATPNINDDAKKAQSHQKPLERTSDERDLVASGTDRNSVGLARERGRASGALGTAAVANGLLFFFGPNRAAWLRWPAFTIALVGLVALARWGWIGRRWQDSRGLYRIRSHLAILYALVAVLGATVFSLPGAMTGYVGAEENAFRLQLLASFIVPWFGLLLLKSRPARSRDRTTWWTPLIDHPARVLVSSFMMLCMIGTALLLLPGVTGEGRMSALDATFTSVSAVCVTGLIVLDTATDLRFGGQAVILLLIQLGGLGIMTISTAALHLLGRRLTLKQERLLTSMSGEAKGDLSRSLAVVVLFTLGVELTGAMLLLPQFIGSGDPWPTATWRAIFTSVSAFCNAGFSLQTDSLIPYASQPLVIHTVAILIIAGGIAPATALAIPRWLTRRSIPAAAYLVLTCSTVLLLIGFVAYLALEWQFSLADLSFRDKLHNAWFQSVTLRTAGFNSVDLAKATTPAYLVMLAMMFIGGSPGGTAGGVKTATVGVLALAMWSNVSGRQSVNLQGRHIAPSNVYHAIAVIGAGFFTLFLVVLALTVTQPLSGRDLIFEATSAVGTVGLSIGATGELDGVGKVIIIVGMFLGRIGPLTLFMMLGQEKVVERQHLPPARIPLT